MGLRFDSEKDNTKLYYAIGFKRSTHEIVTRAGCTAKQARKNLAYESSINDISIFKVVDNYYKIRDAERECKLYINNLSIY